MSLFSFISFFISFLLIFSFAWGKNRHGSNCSEPFKCGRLENMSYPFSEDPNCGLCIVYCDTLLDPRIKLSSYEDWVITKQLSNIITIKAPSLKDKKCDSFKNLSLPNTAPISYTIPKNITLFKCENTASHDIKGYKQFKDCEDEGFLIYHKEDGNYNDNDTLPTSCSIIQLPKPSVRLYVNVENLFELLPDEFDLEWYMSYECYDCPEKGGHCTESRPNCSVSIKDGSKIPLIIGTAGGLSILIFCFVGLIIWRRKKKNKDSSYLLSRSTSLGPSSRSDVESGSVYPGVPVYSYSELEEVTNNFDSSKELGDGGFGVVYYGKLRDGREVAVKRLYEHNYKRVEQFMNEIKILTTLKHPNLVTLYGCTSRRSRELLLVYEYIPNGTVADHLHGDREKFKLLAWPLRMKIALETASALSYLHHSDTIHRDVKTNNILLDQNFSVKVADFGLSRLFPNDVTHVSTAPQGTPGYVDPEYHECYQLTGKSDVYSFGVVLIELISSLPAVDITRHRHEINLANLAINRIQRCEFDELIDSSLGHSSDPEVKRMTMGIAELAFRCLQLDSEMRPTMDEVLETLKDIKESKEIFKSETIKKFPHSPESDDSALLKNMKFPPASPNTVTEVWNSTSTIGGSR